MQLHRDVEAHAKLDRLLATQELHTAKFADLEDAMSAVIQVVRGIGYQSDVLREAIVRLSEAAEEDVGGDDLGEVLHGILEELREQTGKMASISAGLERLPEMLSD